MLTVQQASIENVDIIAPLFDAYRQFYKQVPDLENAYQFTLERLENNESVIFVAYWNNEPVGFTQLYPLFSSVSLRRVWLLNDIYVKNDFRKHGIGTALLERAKAHGRLTNAKALTLETSWDNYTAQSMYEKNGWHREQNFFMNLLYRALLGNAQSMPSYLKFFSDTSSCNSYDHCCVLNWNFFGNGQLSSMQHAE